MSRALRVLLAGLALLLVVLCVRALRQTPNQLRVTPVHDVEVDAMRAAERLAGALRFPTVSHQAAGQLDAAAFSGLRAYLEQVFPRVHAKLQRELVAEQSLLYTWSGSDPALAPVLLLSHLDVVPVEPGTESTWQHPPFGGVIEGGFVWGRGAIDDKAGVVGILEAIEILLARDVSPRRTLVLAFGHDEEAGGRGAQAIAARLAAAELRFEFVLDEGMAILDGLVPGAARPVAVVGVGEKGYATVKLEARASGGHSSMPPFDTAIGILSRAIARLEARPMPPRFDRLAEQRLTALAPEMSFPRRLVLANLWLFRPLVVRALASTPATNALLRTTTAPTMLSAGVKENVLPERASALVNFRILPGDSIAGVLDHVRRTLADPRVEVSLTGDHSGEPSPISSTQTLGFDAIARAVREVSPETIVVPGLVLGATDARHYQKLSSAVYRFLPVCLGPDDLPRVHGANERVAIENYRRAARIYIQLLRRL